MGIGVTVHGYIETDGYGGDEESKATFRHNQRVIESLPADDPVPPFITRSMFSCLPLREEMHDGIPQYDRILIAFAGNYKNMYMLDKESIAKFESLLSRLIWDKASVFVDFCGYKYTWKAEPDDGGRRSESPRPPLRWALTCVSLSAKDVPVDRAVDGGGYIPLFAPRSAPAPALRRMALPVSGSAYEVWGPNKTPPTKESPTSGRKTGWSLSRALFRALTAWFALALIGPPLVVALARASGSLPSTPALAEREDHGPWHPRQQRCGHLYDILYEQSSPEHQVCRRKTLWLSRLQRGYHAVQLSLPILGGMALAHFVSAAVRRRTLRVALPGVLILLVGIGGFVLQAYYVSWVF